MYVLMVFILQIYVYLFLFVLTGLVHTAEARDRGWCSASRLISSSSECHGLYWYCPQHWATQPRCTPIGRLWRLRSTNRRSPLQVRVRWRREQISDFTQLDKLCFFVKIVLQLKNSFLKAPLGGFYWVSVF